MIDQPDFALFMHGTHVVALPQTKRALKFLRENGVPIREGCAIEFCPTGAEIFAETVEDAGLRYAIIRLPSQMTRH